MSTNQPSCQGLTVLYDGGCPLCRREIAVYRDLVPLNAAQRVDYADVSDASTPLPATDGRTRADYLARFHVRRANGELLHGAAAFVALWQALPGWRWLGRFGALPGVTPLLELAYRGFLPLRPSLQRLARAWDTPAIPADLVADLRSDQAGETGAVWIYNGVLAVSRNAGVRAFAQRHRETERLHLQRINEVLPPLRRSWLLVPWRVAGFATGALPALFGPRAVYATIAAVETFVDRHYQQQIDQLASRPDHAALLALLRECQADECEHRDEAAASAGTQPGRQPNMQPSALLRGWCALVGWGSGVAVHLARRV
jgi:demethoxyubiquinone hydroxylase (CLK1/Coq7/Cat5 family)